MDRPRVSWGACPHKCVGVRPVGGMHVRWECGVMKSKAPEIKDLGGFGRCGSVFTEFTIIEADDCLGILHDR